MRELHPEIRKYWEKLGETITVDDCALYTKYSVKDKNDRLICIANFSKLEEDAKHPDTYWITKEADELSYSEDAAIRLMKLKAFL